MNKHVLQNDPLISNRSSFLIYLQISKLLVNHFITLKEYHFYSIINEYTEYFTVVFKRLTIFF